MSTDFNSLSSNWKSIDCIVKRLQLLTTSDLSMAQQSSREGYGEGTCNDPSGKNIGGVENMDLRNSQQLTEVRSHFEQLFEQFNILSSEVKQAVQQLNGHIVTYDQNIGSFHGQLQIAQADLGIVKDCVLNLSSSDNSGIFSRMFSSGTAVKKGDPVPKKHFQDSLKAKEDEISQLKTTLRRYQSDLETKESHIKHLQDKLEKCKTYAKEKEQEANTAKKELQAMILKVRSWEEGHHFSGRKKQSEISSDYSVLFSNNSRPVTKYFKEQKLCQIADVERKPILSNIFAITYKECKLFVLSKMFDELFTPRSEASESEKLERAREQAKIYGYLFGQTVHISPDVTVALLPQIISEVRRRFPNLIQLLPESSKPNELNTFIQQATTVALDMVSSQPPMFIMCPPVTKKQFDPAIHQEARGWDVDADDGDNVVYHRPILYSSFAALLTVPEVKARLAHVRQQCHDGTTYIKEI